MEFVPLAFARVALANSGIKFMDTFARSLGNYRDLRSYCAVIGTLRRKGFSYRDIAEWLSVRGVDADHNAVYRVYTNSLSDAEARMEDDEEELEARLEAQRNH